MKTLSIIILGVFISSCGVHIGVDKNGSGKSSKSKKKRSTTSVRAARDYSIYEICSQESFNQACSNVGMVDRRLDVREFISSFCFSDYNQCLYHRGR